MNIQCDFSVYSQGMEYNFDKYDASFITSFGVPYDYGSVMHYGPYALSWNGLKTMEPKVSKPLNLFCISTCGFTGRICGSSLKQRD